MATAALPLYGGDFQLDGAIKETVELSYMNC